ncbi:hypothetical protein SOM12_18150 [Flavobacterium sp. CFBP9031]|uniref:hypothetical protein n=1 Tax=Flavobacterium sp. CFBP9031 TaxID=3096538 RepID=UPI002A69C4A0|nr:hypothetical protein [Flavobacterium sp. CFBP9031]MDY0989359.1 hypothetical protein [Flavobacterium sp. CFBP9031]
MSSSPAASANIVLLLEDDKRIIEPFVSYFSEKKLNADLIVSQNLKDYLKAFEDNRDNVKCLVMDLNNQDHDSAASINETINQIKTHYENNRIPIFVHSGNLAHFTELDEKGTIIKKQKNSRSIAQIIDSIELMLNSGFLNIFSINGTLDQKIMSEIHSAFVNQFKHNEIEEIIKSIQTDNPNDPEFSSRTREVFERIAVRSIYQNLINGNSEDKSVVVNSIEHYYRRTNTDKHCFYTGDIFENQSGKMFFVATPRCNISNRNFEQILLCEINEISADQNNSFQSAKVENKATGETKGAKQIRTSITDDVTNSYVGERFRFLPPSPQFRGGFVDLKKIITVSEEELMSYNLVISLVDDLTNDVVRKLAGYLLRGGISDTAYNEAQYYLIKD